MDLKGYLKEAVGERLRILRRALDISTDTEMAQLLGVSPQKWNNYTAGRNVLPVEYGIKLAQFGSVTLDYIYAGRTDNLSVRMVRLLEKAAKDSHKN